MAVILKTRSLQCRKFAVVFDICILLGYIVATDKSAACPTSLAAVWQGYKSCFGITSQKQSKFQGIVTLNFIYLDNNIDIN